MVRLLCLIFSVAASEWDLSCGEVLFTVILILLGGFPSVDEFKTARIGEKEEICY